MKLAALLVQLTALFVFIQLLTGGLIRIYDVPSGHVLLGLIVIVLALASMIASLLSKPKYNALRFSSITVFVLVLLAGLATDTTVAFIHYTLAILAFGTAMATTFYAVRWNRMT